MLIPTDGENDVTLLDKAAKALLENISDQGGAYYIDVPSVEGAVRSVLLALREPDRRWAADVCEDICEPELVFNPAPASAFTAMIDAILAEGTSVA